MFSVKHFDATRFRTRFPAFKDNDDETLERYFEIAEIFFSDNDGPLLSGRALDLARELLTAHCLSIRISSQEGTTSSSSSTGIISRSTIDKVSVEFSPPPFSDGFDYWANSSTYGQQLLALLKAKSAGGFYFGGRCERKAFRKAGGKF